MSQNTEPLKHYLHFIRMALLGLDPATNSPNDVDSYFRRHEKMILKGSSLMHKEFPVEIKEVYRGILLEPHRCGGLLKPLLNITYISFSTDENIARMFADIRSTISTFVMFQRPTSKGYLIKHTPSESDIIFHHTWADKLDLGNLDLEVIAEQKEVMLKQTFQQFKLIKL